MGAYTDLKSSHVLSVLSPEAPGKHQVLQWLERILLLHLQRTIIDEYYDQFEFYQLMADVSDEQVYGKETSSTMLTPHMLLPRMRIGSIQREREQGLGSMATVKIYLIF